MRADSTSRSPIEDDKSLNLQAQLCQSLTHPFRLKIIKILENGSKKVGDIEIETKRPQPFISQHLRVLREKGIVTCKRKKHEVYYSLADPKILEICRLIADLVKQKEISSN